MWSEHRQVIKILNQLSDRELKDIGISREDIDSNFNLLLEHIFDIDAAPEIGAIPSWVKAKRKAAKI